MISKRSSLIFRGIAILMVVLSHYAAWLLYGKENFVLESMTGWGVFGVDIFLLLSGYGLVKSYKKNGIDIKFVIKRFFASYFPYIVIMSILTIMSGGIESKDEFIGLITGKFLWYMNVLFVLYIMFMLFYSIGFLKEILITIGAIGFTYWLYKIGRADFWELSNGAFLIGIYFATFEDKLKEVLKKAWVKWSIVAVFAALTIYFSVVFNRNVYAFGIEVTRSMMFTVAMLGLCSIIDFRSYLLVTLGKYSLYIYLLHSTVYAWVFELLTFGEKHTPVYIVLIVALAICVIIGYLFDKLTDYLIKFLNNRFFMKEDRKNE